MSETLTSRAEASDPQDDVLRFYKLAKRAEWKTSDLAWGELPATPVAEDAKPRRRDLWRSVLSQQLQADELAVKMATQLLKAAPTPEAKLYYSTMVQDESRHTEAWLNLIDEVGERTDLDPFLDELVRIVLEADELEEKVFLMQVFFEKAIIRRFHQIAASAGGTVLEQLCEKLAIDDGIHHGSGMAIEKQLLEDASKEKKAKVERTAERALPFFVRHVLWRPPEREFLGTLMQRADERYVRSEVEGGIRRAQALGLDFSTIEVPFTNPNL